MNCLQKQHQCFIGISLILLIAVLFTTPVNGASSWFDLKVFTFQPSEFAKIFVVLFLSMIITRIQINGKQEIHRKGKR